MDRESYDRLGEEASHTLAAGKSFHADWLLQNEWMSVNKLRLSHPAAWIHGSIHGVLLGLIFGWIGGVILALLHILVALAPAAVFLSFWHA